MVTAGGTIGVEHRERLARRRRQRRGAPRRGEHRRRRTRTADRARAVGRVDGEVALVVRLAGVAEHDRWLAGADARRRRRAARRVHRQRQRRLVVMSLPSHVTMRWSPAAISASSSRWRPSARGSRSPTHGPAAEQIVAVADRRDAARPRRDRAMQTTRAGTLRTGTIAVTVTAAGAQVEPAALLAEHAGEHRADVASAESDVVGGTRRTVDAVDEVGRSISSTWVSCHASRGRPRTATSTMSVSTRPTSSIGVRGR